MTTNEVTTSEKQVVLFELGAETYGLDIAAVREIIQIIPVTRVPKAPFFVEGVINLRGRVIPVLDMGKLFGLEKREQAKTARIVVASVKDTIVGIIVDAVTEVLRIPASTIEPVSELVAAGTRSECLLGIAKLTDKMVILLDLEKLMCGENALVNLAQPANKQKKVPAGAAA